MRSSSASSSATRVLGARDAKQARELVHIFRSRAPALTEAAAAAIAKGDGEQAWIAAHKLKALANLVGAHALTEACEAMRGIDCQPSSEAIIDGDKWLQRLRSASQAACAALEAADEM